MKKLILIVLTIASTLNAQVNLTHNKGVLIDTGMFSCSGGPQLFYARAFNVEEFGVAQNEDLNLTSGEIGFAQIGTSVPGFFKFLIYQIDENFPSSFDENLLLGESQTERVGFNFEDSIFTLTFDNSILVPANVEKILVVAKQENSSSDPRYFIGGTEQDNDVTWIKGSCLGAQWRTTIEAERPNARLYITAKGNTTLGLVDITAPLFSAYPNPTFEKIYISNSNKIEYHSITNINGAVINLKINNGSIDFSNLRSGIYFLTIGTSTKVKTIKIVKH